MTALSAAQDGTNRRLITVTATGLTEAPDGTTVFQFGDGSQAIVTAVAGVATAPAHEYANAGTYEVVVLNGNDTERLVLPPVATGLVWTAPSLTMTHDPDGVPLGVELLVKNLPASHVHVTWGDGTTDTIPLYGGAAFVAHKYATAGLKDIVATGGIIELTATDYPVGQAAVVTAIDPTSVAVGAPDFVLEVTATGLVPGAVIVIGGVTYPTTVASATELTTTVDPTVLGVGVKAVGVRNPGVALSNTINLTVTA